MGAVKDALLEVQEALELMDYRTALEKLKVFGDSAPAQLLGILQDLSLAQTLEAPRPGFYLARLDTRNFEFLAVSDSQASVMSLLEKSWESHAEQTEAFWTWEDVKGDVWVTEMRLGDVLRDGTPLQTHNN